MKPIFTFLLFSVLALSAQADVLRCQSYNKVSGWIGVNTFDYVNFSARVVSETLLQNPKITGAYFASLSDTDGTLSLSTPEKMNASPRYRFEAIEDAWHWFYLLVPKDYMKLENPFKASLQMYREDIYTPEYIDMNCFFKKTQKQIEIM